MEKQVSINFSIDEAKIIFDALSAHRHKIINKKETFSDDLTLPNQKQIEKQEFVNQRMMAMESEIEKTNRIFKKLVDLVKREH